MTDQPIPTADSAAERVALWRALQVLVDPPPHGLVDEIGLLLAAPAKGWRYRGYMHPAGTAPSPVPPWPIATSPSGATTCARPDGEDLLVATT